MPIAGTECRDPLEKPKSQCAGWRLKSQPQIKTSYRQPPTKLNGAFQGLAARSAKCPGLKNAPPGRVLAQAAASPELCPFPAVGPSQGQNAGSQDKAKPVAGSGPQKKLVNPGPKIAQRTNISFMDNGERKLPAMNAIASTRSTRTKRGLLKISDAANYFGCGVAAFQRQADAWGIPFVLTGTRRKYRLRDLDAHIDRRIINPKIMAARAAHRNGPLTNANESLDVYQFLARLAGGKR
jgi:hypothetical protein